MKKRFRQISRQMLQSDKYISDRVVELGSTCMELNNLFSQVNQGDGSKLKEVALKCAELSTMADAISYELYLSNQVEIEELEETVKETINKL
ncbi:MAG: hypothetical protein ACRCX8_19750 [Sarcina sp.]